MDLKNQLIELHKKQKLVHAYLIEGGNLDFAKWMSQLVFCKEQRGCGECSSCRRIHHRNHPDVHFLEPNGQFIKIDQVRELKKEAAYKGVEGNRQVFVIVGAEKLNVQAANALLKFIEEPSQDSMIILLSESKESLLPTILSRVQILRYRETHSLEVIARSKGLKQEHLAILAESVNSLSELEVLGELGNEMVELIRSTFELNPSMALLSVQTSWAETFKDKPSQLLSIRIMQSYIKAAWQEKKKQPHVWGSAVKGYSFTDIIELDREVDKLKSGFYSNQHYLLGLEHFFLSIPNKK